MQSTFGAIGTRLRHRLYASSLYRLTLRGPVARHLARLPPLASSGSAENGHQILGGVLLCGGGCFSAESPEWLQAEGDAACLSALHSFEYLADIAAVGGEAASHCARNLVRSWIEQGDAWHPVTWAPATIGARLAAWLSHAKFLADHADDQFGPIFLDSTARQARHLARAIGDERMAADRFVALKGLIYAAACAVDNRRLLARAIGLLRREIECQISTDGAHVQRSPSIHLLVLAVLIDIRDLLSRTMTGGAIDLDASIDRMASVLRFFRHGDGTLALFNGSSEEIPAIVEAHISKANSGVPIPSAAGGFQKISAGNLALFLDAAAPPSPGFDTKAHSGTLSVEFSWRQERLIVNCGIVKNSGPTDALRSTAAHSTLVVDDVNSAEILPSGGLGRRPQRVDVERGESDGQTWLSAQHDGYAERFGLTHRRRLYVSADGRDVRGEDSVVPVGNADAAGHDVAIRFHLHPHVQAALVQNGAAILLRLPSGVSWRFQCSVGSPKLEQSVYFGRSDARRTQQIVVAATSGRSGTVIKWALRQISPS